MSGRRWALIALVALAAIGAGVAATPAAADATAVDETDADANLTSGQVYWEGQTVRIDADPTEHANATWAVFTSEDGEWGDFVTEIALDASGMALIDTADLTDHDSNSFIVTNETGTAVQFTDGAATTGESVADSEFSVVSQAFTASASDSVLEKGETTTIDTSTNRAGFDLDISANDASSAELASIFAGNGDAVIENDDTITVTGLSNTDDLNADLSGHDAGVYTFTLDVTDTSASATVSITVEPSTDEVAAARFLTSGQRYWTGQTVSFDSGSVASGTEDVVRIYTVEDDTVGTLVTEVSIDADGTRLLDTETDIGGQGEYVIGRTKTDLFTFDTGGDVISEGASVSEASFSVVDQGLSTSFAEDTVTTDETASMTLTSNRAIYSVEISSPDATDAEIERIFGGTTVNVSEGSLDADVGASEIAPGEYTFTFDVVDSSAQAESSITVESNGSVELPETSDVDRGDVASIPVELDGTDTAYVAIGRESDDGFRAIVEVSDGNDDGAVSLEANTYTLLNQSSAVDDRFWTADDDDSVENVWYNGSSYDVPLPVVSNNARSYDVRASTGFDTSDYTLTGGTDRTVMRVYERSTGNMSIWTAPSGANITAAEDIRAGVSEEALTQSQLIAEGDYAVAELEVTGIFGALEVQPGNTYAEKLISLDENVSNLNFTVVVPGGNIYGGDSIVDLSANTAALTVIPNQDDGTLYVLMDTSTFDGVADGDQRIPTFTVNAGDTTDTLATSDENDVTVEQAFEMQSPAVEFDENDVSAAPGQTISGFTTFAPGTELTIAVESDSTPYTPSVETEFTATVQADGTWSGQVDFSDGSRGQEYTVSVIEPDVYAAYEDEIGRPVATFDGVTTTEDTVTVERVNLSEGGFVVVKTGSATGSFAGVSGYLDPGQHNGVEIPVDGVSEGETVYAVAHTDANGNEQYDGDGAYTNADGSPVSERATAPAEFSWPTEPAPTDPDGDGLYEDVSGDGDLNFPDVNALFQNTTSDAVQNNVQYFDFDGDGVVGLQDVLALFEMV